MDDSFVRDEDNDNTPSLTVVTSHVPTVSCQPHLSGDISTSAGNSGMPNKEELLIMSDEVDQDIEAVETQISALQKKKVSSMNLNIKKRFC